MNCCLCDRPGAVLVPFQDAELELCAVCGPEVIVIATDSSWEKHKAARKQTQELRAAYARQLRQILFPS